MEMEEGSWYRVEEQLGLSGEGLLPDPSES